MHTKSDPIAYLILLPSGRHARNDRAVLPQGHLRAVEHRAEVELVPSLELVPAIPQHD